MLRAANKLRVFAPADRTAERSRKETKRFGKSELFHTEATYCIVIPRISGCTSSHKKLIQSKPNSEGPNSVAISGVPLQFEPFTHKVEAQPFPKC